MLRSEDEATVFLRGTRSCSATTVSAPGNRSCRTPRPATPCGTLAFARTFPVGKRPGSLMTRLAKGRLQAADQGFMSINVAKARSDAALLTQGAGFDGPVSAMPGRLRAVPRLADEASHRPAPAPAVYLYAHGTQVGIASPARSKGRDPIEPAQQGRPASRPRRACSSAVPGDKALIARFCRDFPRAHLEPGQPASDPAAATRGAGCLPVLGLPCLRLPRAPLDQAQEVARHRHPPREAGPRPYRHPVLHGAWMAQGLANPRRRHSFPVPGTVRLR